MTWSRIVGGFFVEATDLRLTLRVDQFEGKWESYLFVDDVRAHHSNHMTSRAAKRAATKAALAWIEVRRKEIAALMGVK